MREADKKDDKFTFWDGCKALFGYILMLVFATFCWKIFMTILATPFCVLWGC